MLFRGEYFFLSNFFPCQLVDMDFSDITYGSVEEAFQASKTINKEERKLFSGLGPKQAKARGRRITLRVDWEQIKDSIMAYYCAQKFSNTELKNKLMTLKGEIIEENFWGDRYWGVYNGTGKNKLGKILMEIRDNAIK